VTSQDAVALLVPIVSTVLGSLAISLQDRHRRASVEERRRIAFEDAIRRVSFATQWLQARQSLRDVSPQLRQADEEFAVVWLDDASKIAGSTDAATLAEETRSPISRLFLLYEMTSAPAKVVRVVFYLPVLFVGWIALIALDEILGGVTYADQAQWEVTGSIIGGLLAFALRGWAISLDRRRPPTEQERAAATDGSPA
jgi:hypothetical protein